MNGISVRSRIRSKPIFASCLMLRSQVLRVLCGLMQEVQSVYEEVKSEAAEFKECVCGRTGVSW